MKLFRSRRKSSKKREQMVKKLQQGAISERISYNKEQSLQGKAQSRREVGTIKSNLDEARGCLLQS